MSLLKKYLADRHKRAKEEEAQRRSQEEEEVAVVVEEEEDESSLLAERTNTVAHHVGCSLGVRFADHLRQFLLEDERIASEIDRISYVPDAISASCAAALMECIEEDGEWTRLKTRKLKYFGGLPEVGGNIETLPSWLAEISDALVARNLFPANFAPNHVLINQYRPGEGIMHHTDGPMYHDKVVILSLGFPALFNFRKRLATCQIGTDYHEEDSSLGTKSNISSAVDILLQPQSLLHFSEDAYSTYLHGINTWDHFYTQGKKDCNWEDAFSSYLDTVPGIVEKSGNAKKKVSTSDDYVRTSLTIRHMYRM